MKTKNITLLLALAAVFSISTAFAELEVTGKVVHESAMFTSSGQGIGATTTWNQTTDSHGKDLFKTATQAKLFFDGDVPNAEDATMHVELNAFFDNKAIDSDNKYHESYTQRDLLREAYIDAEKGDVSFRVGKQQVVWGTADGMKLLDAINPTDYTEMAQNQMEDSRIPIWMINAEADSTAGDGGSWQVILSEARSHKIAGLGKESSLARSHTNGDAGHAFVMKGVDSITGKVNGFLNVAPALGQVAGFFTAAGSGVGDTTGHAVGLRNNYKGATVSEFVANNGDGADFAGLTVIGCQASVTSGLDTNSSSANCLYNTANLTTADSNFTGRVMGSNQDVTNLIDANSAADTAANWDTANPNSMFEYMGETAFASFFSFSEMKSKYVVEDTFRQGGNVGMRYKNSTKDGLNYSLNYLSHMDPNPYIKIAYEKESGGALTTKYNAFTDGGTCGTQDCTTESGTWLSLQSGGTDWDPTETDVAVMTFTEKSNRIESFGGSFDTAVETEALGPVVLRGEALLDIGVMTPIVDRARLNIGDAIGALTTQKGNRLSYVLGADITALTNMMISAQFIQIANLDYVDTTHTPSDSTGTASHVSGTRYTGDAATMHITNGLQKAEEFKEFYSLFLSKPFGASGEHRWNNIFMFEENGGKWNRLDAEFSINDDVQATVEVNSYFGDENTQFGQLKKSSNVQVGFKYSF